MSEETKRCSKCGDVKAVGEFYILSDGKPYSYCRMCCQVKNRLSRAVKGGVKPSEPKIRPVRNNDGEIVDGKVCTKCGHLKPLSDYWKDSAACKECVTAKRKARADAIKNGAIDPYLGTAYGTIVDGSGNLVHTKRCAHCGTAKPFSEFGTHTDSGIPRSYCRECERTVSRELAKRSDVKAARDANNRERQNRIRENWARKTHVQFKDASGNLVVGKRCVVCGDTKSLTEFKPQQRGDGYKSRCLKCEMVKSVSKKPPTSGVRQSARTHTKRKQEESFLSIRVDNRTSKQCSKCKNEKPTTEFYLDKRTGRYGSWCIECRRASYRERNQRPEVRARQNEWRRAGLVVKSKSYILGTDGRETEARQCSKCGETKALSEFRTEKSGYTRTTCKECDAVAIKEQYLRRKARLEAGELISIKRSACFTNTNGVLVKTCTKCGETKVVSAFRCQQYGDGYRSQCRECDHAVRVIYLSDQEVQTRIAAKRKSDSERRKQAYALAHPKEVKTETRCTICGEVKSITEFGLRGPQRPGQHKTRCKPCESLLARQQRDSDPGIRARAAERARERRNNLTAEEKRVINRRNSLSTNFGISTEDFDEMLKMQGGKCPICGTEDAGGRWGQFHVDHDHDTGRIRGLLCSHCNTSLGLFNDNVEHMVKAITYLCKPNPSIHGSDSDATQYPSNSSLLMELRSPT